jgi:FtsZ-binding cell division protein ZapB
MKTVKTVLLILALNSLAFAQQVSLGDIARQERARQKSVTSKNPVTNETLGTAAALPPTSEPEKAASDRAKPAAAATDSEAAKPADATADGPHDEATWRDAFKQARDKIKRAEDRVQVLQLELNRLNMDLLTRSDIYNREGQIPPLINAKNEELAKAERDADEARERVSQLENELRRAGAPFGWSR